MKFLVMSLASLSLFASSIVLADPTKSRPDVPSVAPALEKYKQETIFGDLWKRPGLSVRDRSIATLAALITRNQTAELPEYLNFALDHGAKPSEISENGDPSCILLGLGECDGDGHGSEGGVRHSEDRN